MNIFWIEISDRVVTITAFSRQSSFFCWTQPAAIVEHIKEHIRAMSQKNRFLKILSECSTIAEYISRIFRFEKEWSYWMYVEILSFKNKIGEETKCSGDEESQWCFFLFTNFLFKLFYSHSLNLEMYFMHCHFIFKNLIILKNCKRICCYVAGYIVRKLRNSNCYSYAKNLISKIM